MIEELQDAIALQIETLKGQIWAHRESLHAETDREQCAIIREKIAQTETLIKTITSLQTGILVAEADCQRAAENFAAWRRLVVEIRRLVTERDKLARQIPPAREVCDFSFARLDSARKELDAHRQRKFGTLALEKERAAHEAEETRLQKDLDDRRAEYADATTKLGDVQGKALELSRKIDGLGWKANRLAPPGVTKLNPDSAAVMSIS